MNNIKSITIVYRDAMDNQTYAIGVNGVLEIQDMCQEWRDGITRRYDVVMDTTVLHVEECSVIVECVNLLVFNTVKGK